MRTLIRSFNIIAIICFLKISVHGQILQPVKWSYASKTLSKTSAILYFKADIDAGWHIYALNQGNGGPVRTSFTYAESKDHKLIGTSEQPNPLTRFDRTFGIDVLYFTNTVMFRQKVKILNKNAIIKGRLKYMACNDHQCLSPEELDFNISIK